MPHRRLHLHEKACLGPVPCVKLPGSQSVSLDWGVKYGAQLMSLDLDAPFRANCV